MRVLLVVESYMHHGLHQCIAHSCVAVLYALTDCEEQGIIEKKQLLQLCEKCAGEPKSTDD